MVCSNVLSGHKNQISWHRLTLVLFTLLAPPGEKSAGRCTPCKQSFWVDLMIIILELRTHHQMLPLFKHVSGRSSSWSSSTKSCLSWAASSITSAGASQRRPPETWSCGTGSWGSRRTATTPCGGKHSALAIATCSCIVDYSCRHFEHTYAKVNPRIPLVAECLPACRIMLFVIDCTLTVKLVETNVKNTDVKIRKQSLLSEHSANLLLTS